MMIIITIIIIIIPINFFMISIFTLFLRIVGIAELELLTSQKTILFQLTEIEWSFEMFYFFSFRS